MARRKFVVGDVFVVQLDSDRAAVGQLIGEREPRGLYYVALFGPLSTKDLRPEEAIRGKPAILGLTMDARLLSGDWKIVANAIPNPDIELPAYKVARSSVENGQVTRNWVVEDFSGTRSRPTSAAEASRLPFRTVSSPMVLEGAMRSLAGLEPWHEAYDKLRPADQPTSRQVFGS